MHDNKLADVQADDDERGIEVEQAGITNLSLPICFIDADQKNTKTAATVSAWAQVASDQRGAHMSRLSQNMASFSEKLTVTSFQSWIKDLRKIMHSDKVGAKISFTLFLERPTPVTGKKSWLDYKVNLSATCDQKNITTKVGIEVAATTLCPCSKEISANGAHSQRSLISADIKIEDEDFNTQTIASLLENCASSKLHAVLKREDEKFVTESAYENARFAEDVVREAVSSLKNAGYKDFRVKVNNFESIHNHDAFAVALSQSN